MENKTKLCLLLDSQSAVAIREYNHCIRHFSVCVHVHTCGYASLKSEDAASEDADMPVW